MLPYKLVYHPGYDLNLGDHVFPFRKYRMIHDRLIAEGFAKPADFEVPAAATDEQVLLVHEVFATGSASISEVDSITPFRHERRCAWRVRRARGQAKACPTVGTTSSAPIAHHPAARDALLQLDQIVIPAG